MSHPHYASVIRVVVKLKVESTLTTQLGGLMMTLAQIIQLQVMVNIVYS